jgi:hypothetical protein
LRFQLLRLRLGERKTLDSKATSSAPIGSAYPLIRTIVLAAGCLAEITALDKFNDLPVQHGVGFHEPR